MIPFTGNPLDRAADKRKDVEWIRARRDDPSTIVIGMRDGKALVRGGVLAHMPHAPLAEGSLFLGMKDRGAYFALELSEDVEGATFEELRAVALTLSPEEASLVAEAKSLFDWHRRHGFCAACGNATRITAAGWQRVCPSCGTEHFPRVDPVVIMLPTFGDRCLLGRQSSWPAKRMSALAGFIEPGETIEEACARELQEEASLVATRVTYFASQPWPFPSSLMIGLFAEVASDAAVADGVELEEVRWLTRAEARAVVEGRHDEVLMPSALGISFHLVKTWAYEE
jgi:NAD+ diphosphatase